MQNNIFTDGIAQEDSLGRIPFAQEIANNVVNYLPDASESLVIGLNGKWGSGKSSLLNFIKKEISAINIEKNIPNAILFDFNPWMFSNQEELQFSFLSELISKIGDDFKDLAQKISELLDKFELAKYLLPSSIREGIDKVKEVIRGFTKEKPVTDIKKDVDDILIQKGIKLYIFIDDIDRLTSSEIAEVFKLIKLNANFKNTIFFVAYDKEVVENALQETFGKHGEKYLEKIVQVDYSIPEILDEKIEEIFFKELKKIFADLKMIVDYKTLLQIWTLHGLRHYFSTLRSIYRYINALRFRLPVIYKEVNLHHFIVVEAIRIFDYEAYNKLYRNYLPWSKSFKSQFDNDNFIESELKIINTKNLIKYLWEDSTNIHHRKIAIFDARYFERYFALSIQTKDISEQEFEMFLSGSGSFDRKVFLEHILTSNKLSNLFEKFNTPLLSEKYEIKDYSLLSHLFNFFDENPKTLSKNSFLIFDSIVNLVLSYSDKEESLHKFINEAVRNTSRMSLSRFFFLWHIRYDSLAKFKNSSLKEYEKLIIQRINNVEEYLASFVKNWGANFLSSPSNSEYSGLLKMFLETIADFDIDTLKSFWNNIFKSDNELAYISKFFLMSDNEGKPARILFNINGEIKIFPEDYKYRFVDAINKADLDLVNKKNREYLTFIKEAFKEIGDLQDKITPTESPF